MRFTNSPYEDFMKEKSYFKGAPDVYKRQVQVGTTPAAWNAGVFSLIRQLSETVILPIAGLILTFVATYELIQLIIEKNNLHCLLYTSPY